MRRLQLIILLLSISALSHAGIGPLRFFPANPTSNDAIGFKVETFICDAFLNSVAPIIEVSDNLIKVTEVGLSEEDIAFCVFPRLNFVFKIGTYPAGTYMVELYMRQANAPGTVRLVKTGGFTVAQGSGLVTSIPSMSYLGLMTMGGLLFFFGILSAGTAPRIEG